MTKMVSWRPFLGSLELPRALSRDEPQRFPTNLSPRREIGFPSPINRFPWICGIRRSFCLTNASPENIVGLQLRKNRYTALKTVNLSAVKQRVKPP
jgi:hypothetical protein